MRLPSLDEDGWELRSAEEAHARNTATFWIPDLERRRSLQRGQGVKLLFTIHRTHPNGRKEISGERMWVVISNRVGNHFIGRLVNKPACELDSEVHYLSVGAEIPFGVEHVADIDDPPEDYADRILCDPPVRRWLQDEGR